MNKNAVNRKIQGCDTKQLKKTKKSNRKLTGRRQRERNRSEERGIHRRGGAVGDGVEE